MTFAEFDLRTVANLPDQERPRERCLEVGPSALSLRECIALVLGSGPPGTGCLGLAQNILNRPGAGLDPIEEERAFFMNMESCGRSHLAEIPGLGPAGQAKLLAALEMGRRYALFRSAYGRMSKVEESKDQPPSLVQLSLQALKKVSERARNEPHEWFGFVPVYRAGEIGQLCLVERGSRTHVNLDPVEIFARLLSLRPQGLFLVHNHPSGNSNPSPQDRELTARIQEVATTFGIQLLGHWVVSPYEESWISAQPQQP